MEIKGDIHGNTIIAGDFNIPFTSMDRSSSQKIKKIMVLDVTLDKIGLIDNRTFHPKTTEYRFFFQVHIEHSPV